MAALIKLSDLVETAFAAALDDSLWDHWAQSTIQAMDGCAGTLALLHKPSGNVEKLSPFGWSRHLEDYAEHWHLHDPLLRPVLSSENIRSFVDTDHVDYGRPMVAEYMKWQISDAGLEHHMCLAVPLPGDMRTSFSIHRARSMGHIPHAERQKLDAILPQIAQAFRLGFTHQKLLDDRYWQGLTEQDDKHAALLDEQGRMIRLTAGTEGMFRQADGLSTLARRILCSTQEDQAKLDHLIHAAVKKEGRSGFCQIARPSGKSPYMIAVYPLVWRRRSLAPLEAAALVKIVDPTERKSVSGDIFQKLFQFTAREAQFATLLLSAHSVETAAHSLGISIATARIYVRNLFAKTSTSRQIDLVNILGKFV